MGNYFNREYLSNGMWSNENWGWLKVWLGLRWTNNSFIGVPMFKPSKKLDEY